MEVGNAKLFVGNLAWSVTEADLRQLFDEVGTIVSIQIILDRETGKSRGFGFVEMETSIQAKEAVAQLNGKPLMGRPMLVREARPENNHYKQIQDFVEQAQPGEIYKFEIDRRRFTIIREAQG